MTRLFRRRAVVLIDDTKLGEGLRVEFKVEKTIKPEPNKLELTVTGLSTATRSKIRRGSKVRLLAGYDSTASLIFAGDVKTADAEKKEAEWRTVIRSGDGHRAFAGAPFSASFPPGTRIQDVIARAASALGVDATEAIARVQSRPVPGMGQYAHGYSASGKASAELSRILSAAGLGWSIQDGKLLILGETEVAPGSAVLLAPDTGMIGSPERNAQEGTKDKKPPLLTFRSLLQPQILPGTAIQVKSRGTTGLYRAETVTHQGDTYGEDFYTVIEAKETQPR